MAYVTRTVDVEIELDLDDFDLEDIIEHLEHCDYTVIETDDIVSTKEEIQHLCDAYMYDRPNFDKKISDFFYEKLGRIVQ
jgi:hypothetical protein